ncbi:MAG: EAL domain-containing protein [Halorhodospira sp.]
MSLEVPTICPGSPELPEMSEALGTFYLAPPLRHTRDRVYVHLRERGWQASFPAAGVMAVAVPAGGLRGLLRVLETLMSEPEMDAASALFMERGETFGPSSLFQARPLSVWTARAGHEWLVGLIREERVQIHYQPILHARGQEAGGVYAYECLLRGLDGMGGLVSPGRMFQAAEMADLEFYLDRMARVAAIRDSHELGVEAALFINFRPTAIYDPAFCLRTTVGAVEQLGLDPRRIVFEVVESERVSDHGHLRHIVDEYRQGGFRIALDDLGAGYGSLNLLKDLEPDVVKIDRELIRYVHLNPAQATIVEAIVSMARNLGITTVAEGVEEQAEYEWLREAGVDLVQGYYFARPAHPPPQPSWG